MPPELLALPADARITHEESIGCYRGSGVCSAGEYRAEVEATIARQAEGFFTLDEAAQVLADSRPGLDPSETVKRFRLAHAKGELPIHQGKSRFRMNVGETIRSFWDMLEAGELDAWLRASAGYGFPPAAKSMPDEAPKASPAAMASRAGAPGTPPPLPTPVIADAFDGIAGKSAAQWSATLGDVKNHGWLLPARVTKGEAPKPSTWDPFVLGRILRERGESLDALNSAFRRVPALKPWRDRWHEEMRERNAFGM